MKKGLVVVNTGNGKGKTTAALGVLMRAWGRDMRVVMLQFFQHSGAQFGEGTGRCPLPSPFSVEWTHARTH
ncbi:MAG: hypothetical protein EXR67_07115 [Dehalococcoidia bacterium]|nr:hypothetical protein [Dehalococcoidia bacterium]